MENLNQWKTSIPTLSEDGTNASSNTESFFSKCFNYSLPPLIYDDLSAVEDID